MTRKIDLTGQTFGDRTVLQQVPKPGQQAHWLVRCSCGKEDVVPSQRLRQPQGSACRKCGRAKTDRIKDLRGQVFGLWRVVGKAPTPATKTSAYWYVQCACGRLSVVVGSDLTSSHSTGCRSCKCTKYHYKIDLSVRTWCWLLGLFHGDGCTSVSRENGGAVIFAAKPPEHQEIITHALAEIAVSEGVGRTRNGVNVYSTVLARDLSRFKVSGVGKERWMFPEQPCHWGSWVAGLLDADGHVTSGKKVTFYQKRHGGFDVLSNVLTERGIKFSRAPRATRPTQEVITILKESLEEFCSWVQPRYPIKAARLGKPLAGL